MSNAWESAGNALKNSRLYVDPAAEDEFRDNVGFTAETREETELLLDDADPPVWVAVLPVAAANAGASVDDLRRAVGEEGTYLAVLSDGRVTAGSTLFPGANAAAIEASDRASSIPEVIEGSVARFESMASSSGGGGGGNRPGPRGGGGGLLPLAILAAAGGGGFLLYRRNKRNRERAELEQVRTALDEDITTYGERLSGLDLDVQSDSKVPIEARQEYGRALDLYENAKEYAHRAERPTDLKAVTNALEEGRWLLGCVQARMDGTPLPERRAPCFFDPGHGPSTEDVEWAPPGGTPRPVPACAADAMRIKQGLDPNVRMVRVGDEDERRPYWDAGPAYGGWAAGYFGAVLPAMMVGTMLGTTMAAPLAYGAGMDAGGGDGGGDWGGGFDGGGGDWCGGFDGGGDFGGGFDF